MTPRKTLRIARWEVSRRIGTADRRTIAVAFVFLLAGGLLVGAVADRGVTVDRGIYRVGVDEENPYYAPVAADPTLAVVDASSERADLVIRDGSVSVVDSPKGRAALAELRTAVETANARTMAAESDEAAAFPVVVTVRYVERGGRSPLEAHAAGGGSEAESTDESAAGGSDPDATGADDGSAESGGDDDTAGDSTDGSVSAPPGFGAASLLGSTDGPRTPADISPPFPFASLVLAFAFILPMNFVVQAYASSVIDERINRRGELLLVSPVSRGDIIVGKALPYLLGMLAIACATAVAIGAGVVAVGAVVPMAIVYLASGFVAGMFARSFKELTFVTVASTVSLTAYVFVPAIFTDVHPIALISPLTLVVMELQGEAVSLGEYVFSTGPFYLVGAVLFALGAGVYREEDMFTQRPVHEKALDAIDSQLHRAASVAKLSVFAIPFVLVAELLAISVLFVFPQRLSIPLLLLAVAVVEEVAKSVAIYAGFARATFDRSTRTALVLGALSGIGFFVGEKLTLVTQLVGLPELALGEAAFAGAAGVSAPPVALLGLLVAPFVLHVVTATVSALGARSGGVRYLGAVSLAVLLHLVYNLAVVTRLG